MLWKLHLALNSVCFLSILCQQAGNIQLSHHSLCVAQWPDKLTVIVFARGPNISA